MKTIQAPKTIGPNLAEMSFRERAADAWEREKKEKMHKAEREARAVAAAFFGNEIEFDSPSFVPEAYARFRHYPPWQLLTFEIEGLHFNFFADSKNGPGFHLIEHCDHCDEGVLVLFSLRKPADLGWFYETYDIVRETTRKCALCLDREKTELEKTLAEAGE